MIFGYVLLLVSHDLFLSFLLTHFSVKVYNDVFIHGIVDCYSDAFIT